MSDRKWWMVGVAAGGVLVVLLPGCRWESAPPEAAPMSNGSSKPATRSASELPQVRVERGGFVDARDGRSYGLVRFDSMFSKTDSGYRPVRQTWMAENLDYSPDGAEASQGNPKAWCARRGGMRWYDMEESAPDADGSCRERGGRVYRWTAAMDLEDSVATDSGPHGLRFDSTHSYMKRIQPFHRGICPEGWHLPTKADWELLLWNLDRNRAFMPATIRWPQVDSGCEGDGCGEDAPDPPPEVLSYLKARVDRSPDWGKEIDLADPYGFGLLPGYSYWTTSLDDLDRDETFPDAPRVSVFVDPVGRYWGWQARYRYWDVPGSVWEGNFVRCIR